MKNETLSCILKNLKLSNCVYVKENIYYINKKVKLSRYDPKTGKKKYKHSKCEFLVITEDNVKKAIVLNCGDIDLHWYVFKKWRGKHVLSNALRTGVIKEIWPEIKTVTCCCDYNDNEEDKQKMTEHLASLAGLGISTEESIWTN